MNSSAFQNSERQFSDITPSQEGVVDTSSATAMGALAGGISDLGTMGGKAFQQYQQDQAQASREARAVRAEERAIRAEERTIDALALKERQTEFEDEYNLFLLEAASGLRSGQITDLEVKTLTTKKLRELSNKGAEVSGLLTAGAKVSGSFVGAKLEEKSFEDLAMEKSREAFVDSIHNNPYHTPEEREVAFEKFRVEEQQKYANDLEMKRLEREAKNLSISKLKREDAEEQIQEKALKTIRKKAVELPNALQNEIDTVVYNTNQMFENGEINEAQRQNIVYRELKNLENRYLTNIETGSAITNGKLTGASDSLKRVVQDKVALAVEFSGDSKYREIMKGQLERQSLEVATVLTEEVPSVKVAAGLEVIARGLPGEYFKSKVATDINKYLTNSIESIETGSTNNDFTFSKEDSDKKESVQGYFKVLGNNIKLLKNNKKDELGKPLMTEDAVLGQVSDVILSMYQADQRGELLKNTEYLVHQLASGEIGKFVGENRKKLPLETQAKAVDSLSNYARKVSDAIGVELNNILPKELLEKKIEGASGQSKRAYKGKPTLDDIELTTVGNSLRFFTENKDLEDKVKEMNSLIGNHLDIAFNAVANVSGESLHTAVEEYLGVIWPAKYGSEETD